MFFFQKIEMLGIEPIIFLTKNNFFEYLKNPIVFSSVFYLNFIITKGDPFT